MGTVKSVWYVNFMAHTQISNEIKNNIMLTPPVCIGGVILGVD